MKKTINIEKTISPHEIDLLKRNFNPPNNIMIKDLKFCKEPDLNDLLSEIQPTSKGWLMRKSQRYENKWSMVFCQIKDGFFTSTKPTSLKVI